MSRGYFADAPYADPAIASQSAIVATTETVLFPVAQYLPIPASDARAGKVYRGWMGGIYSTGASGTLTITPRYGQVVGGVTLGASVAQTVPVSISNVPWFLEFILTIRTANNGTTTSSTGMLHGTFFGGGVAATAGSSLCLPFGGTSGTFDTTGGTAGGIWIGWTLSVAGSCTPQSCVFGSIT
jgi:hypothetical protein